MEKSGEGEKHLFFVLACELLEKTVDRAYICKCIFQFLVHHTKSCSDTTLQLGISAISSIMLITNILK